MKCKKCTCCKKGFFKSEPNKYVCTGVPEPFIINNINNKCVVPGSTSPTKTPEPDNKTQIKVNTLDTQTIIFVIGGCLMGILILFSIVR